VLLQLRDTAQLQIEVNDLVGSFGFDRIDHQEPVVHVVADGNDDFVWACLWLGSIEYP